jgi:predicted DNA-binding ribbon-helix-helix protein
MKSTVLKRSIVVTDHKTSVSLEDAFWKGLKEIASGRGITLSALVAEIDSAREHGNLSSCHSPLCARLLSRSDFRAGEAH